MLLHYLIRSSLCSKPPLTYIRNSRNYKVAKELLVGILGNHFHHRYTGQSGHFVVCYPASSVEWHPCTWLPNQYCGYWTSFTNQLLLLVLQQFTVVRHLRAVTSGFPIASEDFTLHVFRVSSTDFCLWSVSFLTLKSIFLLFLRD